MFKDLNDAKEYFKNDKFATINGMTLDEIGDGYAVTSVNLTEDHYNAAGGVMGGVYFTLADYAFAAASNSKELGTVGLTVNITYLAGAKGDKLIAKCQCVKDGRTTGCYQTEVYDNTDRHVATLVMNAFKTNSR